MDLNHLLEIHKQHATAAMAAEHSCHRKEHPFLRLRSRKHGERYKRKFFASNHEEPNCHTSKEANLNFFGELILSKGM